MKIVYLARGKLHLLGKSKAPKIFESKFGQSVRDRRTEMGK